MNTTYSKFIVMCHNTYKRVSLSDSTMKDNKQTKQEHATAEAQAQRIVELETQLTAAKERIAKNDANTAHDYRVVSASAYAKNDNARQMHRSISSFATKTLLANSDSCEYVKEIVENDKQTFIVVTDEFKAIVTQAMNECIARLCE